MSEPILIALVQLFAIIAASRHRQVSKHTRLIIETYLKQYLSGQELEEYLLLYDELFLFHDMNEDDSDWATSQTLEKIEKICSKIGGGLQQKDKLIIFIKFIEFIEEINRELTLNEEDKKQEYEYYYIIKNAFNLTNNEFQSITSFILKTDSEKFNKSNILTIAKNANEIHAKSKFIIRQRLNGTIQILHLKSVDLLIGTYNGIDDIYLNGHYIYPNHSFIITHGSIIKSQKNAPVYYADIAAELLYAHQNIKLEFTADNIAFKFKNSENGIQPISFNAESGELIGIMGGSGAGKSTLLNLLNGSLDLEQGNIYINGHNLQTEKEALKSTIGYIPQDDLLIDELTVFQNLYFNARLCFSSYSKFKLTRIILKVLHDVDLMSIRDLVVGNPLNKVISGGQRKRLNIALELIREPAILFADEPTSGLSSMDSEMVILLLKEQTIKGKLVMINIHQPSSNIFKLFDKLMILDKGGYPIYYGNPIDSITYFKSERKHINPTESECLSCGYVNPEQLFQITEAKTINKHGQVTSQRISMPTDWYKLFTKKIQPELTTEIKKCELPENNFKVPSLIKQFNIFSLRNIFIKLTNRQYILLNLLEAPILALILAFLTRYSSEKPYMFGDNKNLIAYMFMSVVVALFVGMMVSAEEIIKDRKILKREAFLTLSRLSYLNSKILFLFGLSALQTLLYVLVGNLTLGIHHLTISYWLVLFSTSCFANMVGLNLSSGMNSVVNIYILIPFFLVPQILLSGVIVPFDTLNRSISSSEKVPIVGDLMASRWAFEALAVNEFVNNPYSKHIYKSNKKISNLNYTLSYLIPSIQSKIDETHFKIAQNNINTNTYSELELLALEIEKLENKVDFNIGEYSSLLTVEKLNEQTRRDVQSHLDSISKTISIHRQLAFSERDSTYQNLTELMGSDALLTLKKKTFNTSLEEWVKNKRASKQIIVNKLGFIRKKDPIYMKAKSKIGRAHFYAPLKRIGNFYIETLWFNTIAIWLMSAVLYATLLHNSLRKLMNYFEKRRFGKL
ncbi:MAG: ATP-binding cassette domain-containing protein [Salinivirgaceae bacterium]|jgi:ABC-type multidrug transport system ATPase subunit|nr:ATP-binding cassette domain-containing protein [Salinivirgaceae bacterium]